MGLLDDEDRIPPVWERLSEIFRYPLRSACLVALGVYTFIYLLGLIFFPFYLLFMIAAYVGLYKFAADVLEATAHGWMEPPEAQSTNTSWVMVKLFGLLVGLYVGVFAIWLLTGSAFLTVFVALAFALALPAGIMIVVMTNSLLHALNPVGWARLIGRIGWAYFVAVLLLMLLGLSQGMAEALFAQLTGFGMLAQIGGFLITGYFMIASFHLMGYLIYEKHEALGVEVREPQPATVDGDSSSELLTEVEDLVADGDTDGAIAHLAQALKQGGLIAEHERYRKLLQLQGRKEELVEHAREYIPVLLYGHENPKKAMLVAEEALGLDPGFRPKEPKTVLDLARIMDQFNKHEAVLKLTSGFAREHPKHPDVAENYLLAAKALWMAREADAQALKLLRQIMARYPDHELKGDMEKLARAIETAMGGTPKPA